jgi:hypothetical protein
MYIRRQALLAAGHPSSQLGENKTSQCGESQFSILHKNHRRIEMQERATVTRFPALKI